MTRAELISQLDRKSAGNTRKLKMKGSNLADFDFSGLDLTGADLSMSNLNRANFENAILQGANLSYSSLRGANFEKADLRGANLNYCNVGGIALAGANIEGISMSYTNINHKAQKSRTTNGIPEKLTLVNLLQKPVLGVVIGSLLGALLVYGFNAIIYFTHQIMTAKEPIIAYYYNYVIVQNVTDGIMVFLLTWNLFGRLTRWFQTMWYRHVVVSLLVVVGILAMNTGFYFVMGKGIFDELSTRQEHINDNAPWFMYVLGDVVVANLFLYVLQQGRQLTRKMSEQEIQLLNLEKLKTRAELDALQAKINPHFLYNALNSIASLVHEDPDKAEEMTMLLSKLFRYTTGRTGEYFISLADELAMVRTYLLIEQVRFGERLAFSVDVADPAQNELQVPQFLLQPIVENSVKHGIAKSAGAGRIDVKIYQEANWLYLSVHDSGPAFPDAMNAGYGLRSIQDKLKLLYGEDARVELSNSPCKQVLIAVQLARLKNPLVR